MLVGAAVTWPLTARAQQLQRTRRIGVGLNFQENDPDGYARMGAFRQALEEPGWDEHRNLKSNTGLPPAAPSALARMSASCCCFHQILSLLPATRPSLCGAGRRRGPPLYSWQV